MKLDRLLAKHRGMGRQQARQLIATGQARVDGEVILRNDHEVDRFHRVEAAGELVSSAQRLLHLMLHKPVGILSATRDPVHRTVIDLIDDPDRDTLHLAGRLDRSTSGLVLLTNDGRWSKRLMDPEQKVPKTYLVETADPFPAGAVAAFAAGFHFPTEDIVTLPAHLEILEPRLARLILHEGRYHQIKRMVHRVGTRVTALHREKIGTLSLSGDLPIGGWRTLSPAEMEAATVRSATP